MVGLEKINADVNYDPTALEQPDETLTIEQLNALFPKPKAEPSGSEDKVTK
ncbi:MAG: hypothetical protein ACI8XO_004121 [Verrucomicrobiales bacterium]|jgi:hypothetical protein